MGAKVQADEIASIIKERIDNFELNVDGHSEPAHAHQVLYINDSGIECPEHIMEELKNIGVQVIVGDHHDLEHHLSLREAVAQSAMMPMTASDIMFGTGCFPIQGRLEMEMDAAQHRFDEFANLFLSEDTTYATPAGRSQKTHNELLKMNRKRNSFYK